jgi:hypothetical protein
MSFRDTTKPQDLGPEPLKPAPGAPNLGGSVEAEGPAIDLCTGPAPRDVVRERILVWLAEGAREVTWALCSLPRERWAAAPPVCLGDWPALRHIRHLSLHQNKQVLPAVRRALGESADESPLLSTVDLAQADEAWDATTAVESAESLVRDFGQARFELLHRLESSPDEVWQRPLDASVATALHQDAPVELDWLLLSARQHELQHLAAIWRLALHWDRASLDFELENAPRTGVPLHPADRLEESH